MKRRRVRATIPLAALIITVCIEWALLRYKNTWNGPCSAEYNKFLVELLAANQKQYNLLACSSRIMPEITWSMSNMQQADYSTGALMEEGAHEYKTVNSWRGAKCLE